MEDDIISSGFQECLGITYQDKECRMLSSIGEPAERSEDYVLLSKNCAKVIFCFIILAIQYL